MRLLPWLTITTLLAAPALGESFVGPDWKEGTGGSGDAGSLPPSAQIPVTGLPFPAQLRTISGHLEQSFLVGPPDQQDLYAIYITSPTTFMATTDFTVDSLGFTSFDSQLFLFDFAGLPVVANDGVGAGATVTLPTFALVPGVYYLGISLFNSEPLDSTLSPLFPDLTGPLLLPSNVSLPASWTTSPLEGGSYVLALTGAVFVPAPSALAVLLLVPWASTRRRAGAPVRSGSTRPTGDRPRVRAA